LITLFGYVLLACQPIQNGKTVPQLTPPLAAPFHLLGTPYAVDENASEIRLLVYREGPLARLGHNHVMTGKVRGEIGVSDTAAGSSFRLEIPLESFAVDLPLPRAEEGDDFKSEVSEGARQGTRKNMLGAGLLDAVQYPVIQIESAGLNGSRLNPEVIAHITVRGVTSELKFSAVVIEQKDTLIINASFRVLQSELGMQPFSIMGGALRVRDAIDIRMRLLAMKKVD